MFLFYLVILKAVSTGKFYNIALVSYSPLRRISGNLQPFRLPLLSGLISLLVVQRKQK